jgi:hypothetical protein
MPQIDTPPPQRAATEADGRLDAAMRETEYVTAVEIDAEAKAAAQSHGVAGAGSEGEEATGISEPPVHDEPAMPRTTSEERAAIDDEGLATHAKGDVPGEDIDALETVARERVDIDRIEEAAAPPAADEPFRSLSALRGAPARSTPAPAPAPTPAPAARSTPAPTPRSTPAPRAKPPLSTAPASLPPPKAANIPASGPTPACPQCEAPMAWVEEHLRFYCKSCRMYF